MLLVDAPRPSGAPVHVYLGEAARLRPDWAGRQAEAEPLEAAVSSRSGERGNRCGRIVPRPNILQIAPYVPGKPIEEVKRELGLTDVIKLASNENPLGPSPRAQAAIRAAAGQVHIYPDGNAFRLRHALAAHLSAQVGDDPAGKGRSLIISAEQVMVGNGSDELIKMLAETFVHPGDRVVFPTPSFSEYEFACRVADGTPVAVPLKDFRVDVEAIAAAARVPRTPLVFIANPNNPTGTLISRPELEWLIDQLPPETILVLDEAYYEFVDDPAYTPGLLWVAEGRPVVVLRTFSKIYGLAGLRVGYGVAPAELVALVQRVREPFNVNSLAQEAALAALEDTDHVARSRQLVREGREELTRELTARGMRVIPSQANFLYFDLGCDGREVFRRLLQEGVIVRTGDIFGNPTFLRVTVGLPEQNRRFLAALDRVLAAVRSKDG
ncbi:MAG: histidinol-phosphate transaminase [Limnochordales bacterium]|nr:histidinol-phosphate transaminase [Limnochordales bacterium]